MTQPPAREGLDVALATDVYRDALAVIRAYTHHDHMGAYAVLSGTDAPRQVAAAMATTTVILLRRLGLDDAQITALLAELDTDVCDAILDNLPLTAQAVHDA